MSSMDVDTIHDDDGNFTSDGEDVDFDYDEGSGSDADDFGDTDDDLGLDSQPTRPTRKSYEVEFTTRSMSEIMSFQAKESNHVAGIIAIAPSHAATLLRHFNWNKELLMERYMEDPEKVVAEACVILDDKDAPKPVKVPGFVCDVCCDDHPDMLTISLLCGHRFCTECYTTYLVGKVKEGESRRISCMGKCSLVVDEATVKALVDANTYKRYEDLLLRTYVDDSQYLRWCPAPGCEMALECHVPKARLDQVVPVVTCSCGLEFCFGCGSENHQPCVCSLAKLWRKKMADDSETANWINANTRECPKCESTIEKNGGCNHMTCRKCKYEWCWVCSGPWAEHGSSYYQCNRFDEDSSVKARSDQEKARAALKRYMHYFTRFDNHMKSAALTRQHSQKTEEKMAAMQQQTSLSWIEVQFLKTATDVVCACRQTLQWTYAFAYYLDRNNMTELFEANQRDLEMAVEQLSGLLESEELTDPAKIDDLRTSIVNKMVYVQQRREVVLEDTAAGLKESRWTWTTRSG
ncbi:hypothetical protein BCR44DRAFT_47457 [Catenaria anguillulae PL171]|uniref:RBR-type E3 ubiquitin transferase n=1 Tax=Catenaria anguillulae PL171 TaxID=765915 RepID=A0A1Y2HUJ3_9FUNG|nr:hypothetical protein BCR44DRAFT_47457 [Catenaria anguillulae PL171]